MAVGKTLEMVQKLSLASSRFQNYDPLEVCEGSKGKAEGLFLHSTWVGRKFLYDWDR